MHEQNISTNTHVQIDRSLCPTGRIPWISFRGAAVTNSLHWPWQDGPRNELNTYQELYLKDNAHLRHFKTPLTICCTSTTVLKLARKMEDDWMPKDILYGEPQVSWQSVGCSLFQRGIPAKTKEATVQARTKQTIQRQNWCNGRISSDEGMRQRLRVRKEKIFLSLFTATVLCGALLKKKKNKILIVGFEEAW